MTVRIEGVPELKARIKAITPDERLMRRLAVAVTGEAKRLAPRRTSNLSRSIVVGHVGSDTAQVKATANYAAYVELGTRAHEIRPRNAKALRFAPGRGARLTGTPRRGAKNIIFAKKVRHPGTKAHPFMAPAIKAAARAAGFAAAIIKAWNEAA
jgi:hypothetical protein